MLLSEFQRPVASSPPGRDYTLVLLGVGISLLVMPFAAWAFWLGYDGALLWDVLTESPNELPPTARSLPLVVRWLSFLFEWVPWWGIVGLILLAGLLLLLRPAAVRRLAQSDPCPPQQAGICLLWLGLTLLLVLVLIAVGHFEPPWAWLLLLVGLWPPVLILWRRRAQWPQRG